VPGASLMFNPKVSCHRAVSSIRADCALMFGGADLSTATTA
jgi:hypothetical protein